MSGIDNFHFHYCNPYIIYLLVYLGFYCKPYISYHFGLFGKMRVRYNFFTFIKMNSKVFSDFEYFDRGSVIQTLFATPFWNSWDLEPTLEMFCLHIKSVYKSVMSDSTN